MTLWGIDVSKYQSGIDMQKVKNEGYEFVIARVGQGAGGPYGTVRDAEWPRHRDSALNAGLVLCAYWYIGNTISPKENAQLCANWIGDTSIPIALDFERGSGDIAFFRATIDAFISQGMHVRLSYIPRWYWKTVGSPDLSGLPPLWSSKYVNNNIYPGDDSNYWDGYGSNTVAVLQYSSSMTVAGRTVDVNAFKGTRDDFINLLGRGVDVNLTDTWIDQYGNTQSVQETLNRVNELWHYFVQAGSVTTHDGLNNSTNLKDLIIDSASWSLETKKIVQDITASLSTAVNNAVIAALQNNLVNVKVDVQNKYTTPIVPSS